MEGKILSTNRPVRKFYKLQSKSGRAIKYLKSLLFTPRHRRGGGRK
ncbi:MAG: hypothetical protein LBR79_00700 [Oscillospiraceae bacterium]|nr:hypothetical protein [Oscillospiraceae bacterium]